MKQLKAYMKIFAFILSFFIETTYT